MQVEFRGVRGSTPSPSTRTAGVGGNTSCVTVTARDGTTVLLDLGTGARGVELPAGSHAVALLTHLHFDHVQGLPFCPSVLERGSRLDIYGPPQSEGTLEEAVRNFVRPPTFPVGIDDLPAEIAFIEVHDDMFDLGGCRVTVRPVPHCGPTNGYRLELDGATLAYVPDHQEPATGMPGTCRSVAPEVIELCRGADLVIHDSQYTPDELVDRKDWGHCTARYAVEVAIQSEARHLALFHHDPGHDDEMVASVVACARSLAGPALEVSAAVEGCRIGLGRSISLDP